jgi:hypothetical protein
MANNGISARAQSARCTQRAPAAPARPARTLPRPILNHARDIKPNAHAVAPAQTVLAPSQPAPDAHSRCGSASFESEQFYSDSEQQEHMRQEVLLLTPLARQLSTADADAKVRTAL